MQKIKVAIIGLGNMGINHLRVYTTFPHVNVVALCDISEKRLEHIRKLCPNAKTYTDYGKMFQNQELDCVSIVVPTQFHKDVALAALHAQVPMLIEKPITKTIEEAMHLFQEFKDKQTLCLLGHIERFNPVINFVKQKLDEGIIGKVYTVQATRIGVFPIESVENDVIKELAIHDLDILFYFFQQKIKKIHAAAKQNICTQHMDHVSCILELGDGIVASLYINWISPIKKREMIITGEKGLLHIDYIKQEVKFYKHANTEKVYTDDLFFKRRDGEVVSFEIEKKEPLLCELSHFLDCVLCKAKPLVGIEDGIKVLELAEKIAIAAKGEDNTP